MSSQLSPAEQRQIVRKQRLKEYCRLFPFHKPATPNDLHMLAVDDKQKFIYCVVSKVGTTTWKSLLARPRGTNPKTNRWRMWRRISGYSEEQRSQRLNTYFKFLFVREPWQRMVSAYKDKYTGKNRRYSAGARRKIITEFRPETLKHGQFNFVSFPEFIQYFSDNKSRNQHWRQYEKICYPCVVEYDFIGHYETLKEDADLLLKLLRLDDQIQFPPIHNPKASENVTLSYYSKVPTKYLTKIGEQFRRDFEMFGYEYPGILKELMNKEGAQENNEN